MADSNGKAIQQIVLYIFHHISNEFYRQHLWCWRFIKKRLSHGLPNVEASETLPSSGHPQEVHSIQVPEEITVKLPKLDANLSWGCSFRTTVRSKPTMAELSWRFCRHSGIPHLKVCKEQIFPLCLPRGWSWSWRHWKRWSRRPMPPYSAESNHIEGNHSPDDTHLQGQRWP